jgi:hypothetical protein
VFQDKPIRKETLYFACSDECSQAAQNAVYRSSDFRRSHAAANGNAVGWMR